MNFLISVDIPEYEDCRIIQVENADDEMHARLAAYYLVYGISEQPTRERVTVLTGVWKNGGRTDAKFYVNSFKDKDGSN